MNFSPDDPKLTAYALGELSTKEAAEVERAVNESPELQGAVAEIRQTAALLQGEFAAEPGPVLSEKDKATVVGALAPHNIISFPHQSFWRTAGISAVAAAILCLLAWQFWLPKQEPTFSVAQNQPPSSQSRVEADRIAPADDNALPEGAVADAFQPPPNSPAPSPVVAEPEVATKKNEEQKLTAVKKSGIEGRMAAAETAPQQKRDDNSRLADSRLKDIFTQAKAPPTAKALNNPAQLAGASSKSSAASPAAGQNQHLWSETIPTDGVGAPLAFPGGIQTEQLFRDAPASTYEFAAKQGAKVYSRQTSGNVYRDYYEGGRRLRIERNFDMPAVETARYPKYAENNFESVAQSPLSTFSIDVDTASYANVRRFLNEGRMPPRDAVRIEEMINYFSYDYPQPKDGEPFSVNMEVASCPWQPEHQLLRVGLKGKEMAQNKRPPSNFVFLIDVSGSMSPQERLPLIKQSLRMLVKRMTENDRIAIVVYASSSGVVLESTSCVNKEKILEALDRLEAGGSTNGGQGIQRAYTLAEEHFIKGGVNRVILCTDGDFNVGVTNQEELISLIQRKAKSGVYLSVLGVGTDNYKDALMQKLADKGNGNYHYLDSVEEAHKVLVQQMNGTLATIAKDVKIQIEFNPSKVSSYRLIGYEKRILTAEDFNNDKKDAGEIGAGHTVTALYEIVPAGVETSEARLAVDTLKYQKNAPAKPARAPVLNDSNEILTLKLRYKKPDGDKSVLREHPLANSKKKYTQASSDFRFAAAVASFGMVMKDSEHKGTANFGSVMELAKPAKGDDAEGYRSEFLNLVKKARGLERGGTVEED